MSQPYKILVAYFSCSGTTRRAAKLIADAAGADLYEITPAVPYTSADLNWMDKHSRSTVEMEDSASRPAVSGVPANLAEYNTVFIGFPIWWYTAPTIIHTFLESSDFSGKTLIPFATSGGSGLGNSEERLRASCSAQTVWKPGKLLNSLDKAGAARWVHSLGL